jgi:hypothetical protein
MDNCNFFNFINSGAKDLVVSYIYETAFNSYISEINESSGIINELRQEKQCFIMLMNT